MNILVTGADGFIGRNLVAFLNEAKQHKALPVTRSTEDADLSEAVQLADVIIHLAGVNRPKSDSDFTKVNVGFTEKIINLADQSPKKASWIFASSVQATTDNPYGRSKLQAEQAITEHCTRQKIRCTIFRFPGVFGKWCKPNYNSVVATFCHNISRGIPVTINEPDRELSLVYIDDVVEALIAACEGLPGINFGSVSPVYKITVKELSERIAGFKSDRENLRITDVGKGMNRALYATYVSFFTSENISYELPVHTDSRGGFAEFLKTRDSGQFSFLTAHPGETRGAHYHHSKTEKFLVVKGMARFRFRSLLTGDTFEVITKDSKPFVVDTIPGYVHDLTNIGNEILVVMLWANEVFDRNRPDTFAQNV